MTHFPTNLPPGGTLNRDSIGTELNHLLHQSEAVSGNHSNQLFTVHSASKWMEQSNLKPIPKMLFGQFWYEGELCILFADSNLGKSILAVQIGNSITRNEPVKPFKLEAWPQQILYFDFELADKQFEARYSLDYASHYHFSGGFLRAELDPSADIPTGFINFDAFLHRQLEELIISSGSKILIIDNLTYLRSETERAKDALPLMKHLKSLKTKYGLSILALAHTPKRDPSKPISRNDLQGSKMLMNFCDSAFAIGESHKDKKLRYVKQIKQRNTEELYGADNIGLFCISKPHNFLQYEFTGFGREWDHLRQQNDDDRTELKTKAAEMKAQGKSLRDIGSQLGISYMKVDRLLKSDN